ncbi:MAG: DUF6291 domain-containing protein [Oscillospiraceae bacterium]|jgi:hypothetical protein|nr:DUF6291 domain-containing protein [Oscillospiraceae bacterium]
MRKSFIVYTDWYDILKPLSDKDYLKVMDGAFRYHRKGSVPHLTGAAKTVFTVFRLVFDRNNELFEKTCRERAAAGRLSGAARRTKGANVHFVQQTGTNRTENENENGNGNENGNVRENGGGGAGRAVTPVPRFRAAAAQNPVYKDERKGSVDRARIALARIKGEG